MRPALASRAADGDRGAALIAERLGLPEIVGRMLAQRGIGLDDAPRSSRRGCATSCPTRRISRHGRGGRAPRARGAARRADRRVRRLRRRRRDLGGAAAALLRGGRRRASGSMCRTGCAKATVPTRRRCCKLQAGRRRASSSRSIAAPPRTTPLAAAAEAGLDVDRRRPPCRRAAAAARACARDQPEPARRDSPHGNARRGRRRLSAGRRAQPRAARSRLVRGRAEPDLLQWLDLVALGTVCDVVPLTGLNRALVAQGIKVARGGANPGLRALAAVGGVERADRRLSSRLRAGPAGQCRRPGRRRRSRRAPARDRRSGAGRRAGARLDGYNRERREIEARGAGSRRSPQVEAAPQSPALVFVAAEGWHPGVIGIVAARLKERYKRPACVVALDGRRRQGLGPLGAGRRARPGGHRRAPGRAAASTAAGHAMAAGFTVAAERLEELARIPRRAARRRARRRGAGAGTGDRRRAVGGRRASPG